MVSVLCNYCNSNVNKYPCHVKPGKKNFCNVKCKNEWQKEFLIGSSNPNFGNNWTNDKKESQSILIKTKVDKDYRLKCAAGMSGKKVSEETKEKRKKTILSNGGYKTNHSKETREKIGIKSKEKFTEEFKKTRYNKMVSLGYWFAKDKIEDYKFYAKLSNWDSDIFKFNLLGFKKLEIFGLWHHVHNKKGVVRDHRFSRKSGFLQNVFPELIKHPVNCELITHADNIRKQQSKTICSDSISLEHLFTLIENYNHYYEYNDRCKLLINMYRSGNRYAKENYYEQ